MQVANIAIFSKCSCCFGNICYNLDAREAEVKDSGKVNVRRDRFLRLAEKRVDRAVDAIRLVGNLSDLGNYEYSADEAKRVIGALENELGDVKVRFRSAGARASRRHFSLGVDE